ncbi:MAG: hypothetical protein WBM61_13730 [Woeseiaceae bacterium]|jgi:hypothetical protein
MTTALAQELTIERFESGQIDADRFDHEAHVYVAWLFVTRLELADAIARFDSALRRLTAKLGVPEKYHATITWFFLLLVAERSRYNEGWQAFKTRNPELIRDNKVTLNRYYSEARLFSDLARRQFVLPDRLRT